jgi:hypothetical protein
VVCQKSVPVVIKNLGIPTYVGESNCGEGQQEVCAITEGSSVSLFLPGKWVEHLKVKVMM